MKDFSRSHTATSTLNVAVSRKRCKIELLLLQTTNIESDVWPTEWRQFR